MITADQLVAHAVGDYILQSDWMATEKVKRSTAAFAHVVTYTLPFLLLSPSPAAIGFIMVTHFAIDRWRLARYVCWAKNFLAPRHIAHQPGPFDAVTLVRIAPWSECSATGYPPERPAWLTTWLLIICDNTLHVLCNGFALWCWP